MRVQLLDLRWGVDTSGAVDEAAASDLVLDVCLNEIERCRPLFVGLVGQRFGWVPPRERIVRAANVAALADLPFGAPEGLSVTALEFWAGALRSESRALIYRRVIDGEAPGEWLDADPSGVEWLLRAVKGARDLEPERVTLRDYRVDSSYARGSVAAWARGLVEDLWPLARERAASLQATAFTPYAAAAELRRELLTQVVCGRSALSASVVDALRTDVASPVVISGQPGSGKSTVLFDVEQRLRDAGAAVAIVQIGVGREATSTCDNAASVGALLEWWGSFVTSLPAQAVVMLDGLDNLER